MMHNNDVAAAEEQFSLLLEAFDEALAEGRPPPEIPPGLPDELRTRLVRARACLEALQQQADAEPPAGELETWLRSQETTTGPPPGNLQLGRFRILRELGRGGSGIVFLARDLRLSRQVALKVPLPEVLFTPELRRRFLQEATAAACLDHANLVSVHDADEEGPLCYIVSAYCPGPTLSTWLRDHPGPVPVDVAARLVAALADAVAYIHGKGIIHRDIKPGNVLLEPKEEVTVGMRGGVSDELTMVPRLTDFGLAKLWESGGGETRTGAVLGTPAYMAPEQAQGRKDIGPAADVYALGVILYELLSGQAPFRGESDPDTLRQVVESEPVSPRRLRPAVPRDLETICLKCLEKEPGRRYASAAALADDLRRFLRHEPISARRPRWWERLLKWVRRRPAVAVLAAVSSVAVLGLLVGSVWYGVQTAQHNADLEAALQGERKARKDADKAREDAERAASWTYLHAMQSAQSLLELGQTPALIKVLEAQQPISTAVKDHRGFEWYYLRQLTHTPVETLPGSQKVVYALALSPDGKTLVGGTPKGVKLWELAQDGTWRGPTRSLAHNYGVTTVAFSPDGKILAAGGGAPRRAGELKLWDMATGDLLADLKGIPSHVGPLGFSADGERLIAVNEADPQVNIRGELRVWQIRTRQEIAVRPTHPNAPTQSPTMVAYSPDSARLALGGSDGRLQIWDASRLTPERADRLHDASLRRLKYSPNGKWLATGGNDGQVIARSVLPGSKLTDIRRYQGGHHEVEALEYSPDGKVLAAGFVDGMIRLWEADTGRPRGPLLVHATSVHALLFTPDGTGLLSAGNDGTVKRWDLRSGRIPALLPGHRPEEAWSVAFSPDGKTLASGGDDHQVRLWDAVTGKERAVLRGHAALVTWVAYSPDGTTLASGSFDKTIRLWDVEARKTLRILKGHQQDIRCLAFSPDGKFLVSGGGTNRPNQPDLPGEILSWDAATGQQLNRFPGHRERVHCVAFSPDGRLLASGSTDQTVLVRDWASGVVVSTLREDGNVYALTFSPDGMTLATGTGHKDTVRLWDVRSGRERAIFKGHTGRIVSLAFTPKGRTLASASRDGTVKLWHTATGQELLTIRAADRDLNAVTFDRDSRSMAVAAHNGSVLLYRTDRDESAPARDR